MRRRNKYNNRKIERYGITFDSIAESQRYLVYKVARGTQKASKAERKSQ